MEQSCYISSVSLACAATDHDTRVTEAKGHKCKGLNTFRLNTDISMSGHNRQLKTERTKAKKVDNYE